MSWDEILGQERAVSTLRRCVDGRLPPAILLFGPRGVGKGLAARTIAEALLCETRNACGQCLACGKVGRETHPDFLRLFPAEGKRWITVEQARQSIGWLHRRPLEADRRVLVIDPADSLRTEAANALLKTLEEPPPYGVAVLISDSPASLLETVVSRCQPVRFRPLADPPLREILRREGMDPSRVEAAMRLAGGSAGRALAFVRVEEEFRFLRETIRGLGDGDVPGAARSIVDRFEGDRERLAEALEMIGQLYRDQLVRDVGAEELASLPEVSPFAAGPDDLLRVFPLIWRSRVDVTGFVDPALVILGALSEIEERGVY